MLDRLNILKEYNMATAKKIPTIAQWVASFNRALTSLTKNIGILQVSILIKQKSPFNFPRTRVSPEKQLIIVIRDLFNAITIANQIQDVLLANGVPIDKVKSLMVDAVIMLKSTFIGQISRYDQAETLLKNPSKLASIVSIDIERIKNWVTTNIVPLIKK